MLIHLVAPNELGSHMPIKFGASNEGQAVFAESNGLKKEKDSGDAEITLALYSKEPLSGE